tara:strand:- start:94 stop:486 length:393 start_codon:yes stop_codon:yes gene_type:complete
MEVSNMRQHNNTRRAGTGVSGFVAVMSVMASLLTVQALYHTIGDNGQWALNWVLAGIVWAPVAYMTMPKVACYVDDVARGVRSVGILLVLLTIIAVPITLMVVWARHDILSLAAVMIGTCVGVMFYLLRK